MILGKQHHVAIICSDYEKAKAFYMDKLGFQMIREVWREAQQDHMWMLQLGDICLELFIRPDAPERVTNPEAQGLRHLAFHVDNVEEGEAWLRGLGIETDPIQPDPVNGGRYLFFKDPDGLPLELHE